MEQEQHDLHYLELMVNGEAVALWVEPGETLLDLLREQLQLFGTKSGCNRGECGACTVLLDGQPVYACLLLAVQAQNKELLTIEGLRAPNGDVHPVQRAFIEHNAVQCGFCTPGILLTVSALLQQKEEPTDDEILHALEGHVCRCGAYPRILEAIRATRSERERHAS